MDTKVTYTPYPFQWEAINMMDKSVLLCDDCGLGKTITASRAVHEHVEGPVLVIAPRTAKLWWESVLAAMYPNARIHVSGVAGRGLPSIPPRHGQIWITHPESLLHIPLNKLLVQWGAIIVDEAHRFKNRQAKRTKVLFKLKANVKWALTATPYGRNPADMWALLHWLYPAIYTSYWRFFIQYVDAYNPPGRSYHIIKGGKNLDLLAGEIAPFYIHRTEEDVGVELPPVTTSRIPVRMDDTQVDLYTQALRDMYLEWKDKELTMANVLVLSTRLQQIAADPRMLFKEIHSCPPKEQWIAEWLEDHPFEPVIVASHYRHVVLGWPDEIPFGKDFAVIVGGMSSLAVEAQKKKFERTGRLFGTIGSIAETLNLQRAAHIVIVDGEWSSTTMYQLVRRIQRIGQTKPCAITYLAAVYGGSKMKPTIDRTMYRRTVTRLTEAETLREFAVLLQQGATNDQE